MVSNITKKYMLRNKTKDWYVGLEKPIKGKTLIKGPDEEILLETKEEIADGKAIQARFPEHIVVEEMKDSISSEEDVKKLEEKLEEELKEVNEEIAKEDPEINEDTQEELIKTMEENLSPEELELLKGAEEIQKTIESFEEVTNAVEEVNEVGNVVISTIGTDIVEDLESEEIEGDGDGFSEGDYSEELVNTDIDESSIANSNTEKPTVRSKKKRRGRPKGSKNKK